LVEELADGFVKDWSSQSEEPSWESVKSCDRVMEIVEEFEHTPFRNVLKIGGASGLLAGWLGIGGVSGDGSA